MEREEEGEDLIFGRPGPTVGTLVVENLDQLMFSFAVHLLHHKKGTDLRSLRAWTLRHRAGPFSSLVRVQGVVAT